MSAVLTRELSPSRPVHEDSSPLNLSVPPSKFNSKNCISPKLSNEYSNKHSPNSIQETNRKCSELSVNGDKFNLLNGKSGTKRKTNMEIISPISPASDECPAKKFKSHDNKSEHSQDSTDVSRKEQNDQTLAYNVFLRRVVDRTVNRSITFCEQPKAKIATIEEMCRRQFPDINEDLHRTKIRCYLKSCRRNAKKQFNRACSKDGSTATDINDYMASRAASPPTWKGIAGQLVTQKAKEIAEEALESEKETIEKMEKTLIEEDSPSVKQLAEKLRNGDSDALKASSLPSPLAMFPLLPLLNSSLQDEPSSKSNAANDENSNNFLQGNFWRSVEMVKAMRLSAGFILMSAQKIEDALLADFSKSESQCNDFKS